MSVCLSVCLSVSVCLPVRVCGCVFFVGVCRSSTCLSVCLYASAHPRILQSTVDPVSLDNVITITDVQYVLG